MSTIFLMLIFAFRYHRYDEPPIRDYVSPLVSSTILVNLVSLLMRTSEPYILLTGAMNAEIVGDFYMDKKNLKTPVILFSLAHVLRVISFYMVLSRSADVMLLTLALLVVLLILINKKSKIFLVLYGLIIFLSAVSVSMAQGTVSIGYTTYIVSDLIIGYEMAINKIKPRWIRVILVPFLYWMAQYNLGIEYIHMIES